jgi:multiple sugar transport system substrate-binding protein/putative aldouronate transport system substrate-binding protein
MKRKLALALAIILAFTACSCKTEKSRKNTSPITLTVFSQVANYTGKQVGWFADVMLERFNVILNIIPDTAGTYETRFASESFGDLVIFGNNGNEYKNAAKAGMLLDWEKDDLLSNYGPYIKENMDAALDANRKLTDNGHVYGIGNNVAGEDDGVADFFYTWDLRWDLYEKLGCPEITELDDMVKMFEGMKELEPTDEKGNPAYALSIWPDWDGSMMMYAKALASGYYGFDEMDLGLYDAASGEFHGALEKDGPYIEMLAFLNKLYRKNLLDPDSMTQTYVEMAEKMLNGGCYFSLFDYAGSNYFNNDSHLKENKIMLPMLPQKAAPAVYELSKYGGQQIWSIGSSTKYPELCMEIINWLCTPEGFMTMEYGKQGDNWDYDDKGYPYLTEFGLKCMTDGSNPETKDEAGYTFKQGQCQINNTTWARDALNPDSNGATYNWNSWEEGRAPARTASEAHWRSFNDVTSVTDYLKSKKHSLIPASTFSNLAKDDEYDIIIAQVSQCIVNYSWNAVYSDTEEEFEKNISEMIERGNAYGYGACLEWSVINAAARHRVEVSEKNE